MPKRIIAYFSASGVTKKVAEKLASLTESDLYEIEPKTKYTKADLNWMDKNSRSSIEMGDKVFRPAIVKGNLDASEYDTVYLGFPIWWYVAPTIINTFLETYDFSGKRIVLFATSGESGFGDTVSELQPSAPEAEFVETMVFHGIVTEKKLQQIVQQD